MTTNLLLFLLAIAVIVVNVQLRKLIMTFEEYGTQMDALAAQLNKALQEIIAEIQNVGTVPQALVDKLTAAQAVAQQLDDLNPDTPALQP